MTDTGQSDNRIFGGRYEIQHRIARGGMADVFLARDQLLDRPVALKVLFAELSVDPSFVERFRREAQNAAKLSHPNVVSVYDWGEEGSTYYIVMEYIDGKPLSVLLRENGPLPPRRAAAIGGEVASALSFAHHNGVIHRDVKPGNVMIDERGSVKVTDFGIARARNTTENLTQTGAVMGTATYFSPEQAQGLTVDERSDVYSLGVVLYELVAGKPPFAGDNPVTIAYKHVREQPQPLRQINSQVPPAYEAVVLEAMAKTPANRYHSADDLRDDLERFLRGEVVHATSIAPPLDATRMGRPPEAAYADSVRTIPSGRRDPDPERFLPRDREKSAYGPLFVLLGILAVLAIGAIVLLTSNSLTSNAGDPTRVPNVVGQNFVQAQNVLREAQLRSTVVREENEAARDTVIAQTPAADATVPERSEIRLTVSDGPPPVNLPNVTGQSLDAARRALQSAGLRVETTETASTTVEQGSVISQDPPSGTRVERGDTVTLTVSSGPEDVTVPNVVGFTQSVAAQALSQAGLRTSATEQSSNQPAGTVISSDPQAGEKVERGTTVTITVSNGQGNGGGGNDTGGGNGNDNDTGGGNGGGNGRGRND